MNNVAFGKTTENVRKHSDIKLVTTKAKRDYLLSKPNYHTTKFFLDNLLAIEIKKEHESIRPMNKSIYLGLSILKTNKIVICEF